MYEALLHAVSMTAYNNSINTLKQTFCPLTNSYHKEEQGEAFVLFWGTLNEFYALLGFLLNLWFLATFAKHKSIRKKQNIVLCGLSVSDLLGATCVQVLFGAQLILKYTGNYNHLCWIRAITLGSMLIFFVATFMILTLMSLERYLAVFNEDFYFRNLSRKRLSISLTSLWIIIITAGIFFSTNGMMTNKLVVLGYSFLFVLAALWNVFAYARIFWYLKTRNRSILALERRLHGQELSNIQARRSYKCLAILIAFFISYIPYLVLVAVSSSNSKVIEININIPYLAMTLLCLNSSINPCVYLISSPSLRSKMAETISSLKNKLCNRKKTA